MKLQELLRELDIYGPITLIKFIINKQLVLENTYLIILGLIVYLFWLADYFLIFTKPQFHIAVKKNNKKHLKFYFYYLLKFSLSILCLISFIYISFSLSNPRKISKIEENDLVANDIFIVVDTSRSMLANDFSPNRMEITKARILEFINLRSTDRVGIILFSEKIYTLMPLTRDISSLQDSVDEIRTGILGDGTNIGDALALTIARLNKSNAKNKVIILFTDGVSQVESITPIQAAKMAKDNHIKIYTIAIGKDKDAKIPLETDYNKLFGSKNKRKKYIDNIQYQSIPGGSVDTEILREISKVTGGKFYHAYNENALEKILSDISLLEKTSVNKNIEIVYQHLSFFYMFWGIMLLLVIESIRRSYYEIG